jgi:hypothetical protein
MNFKWVVNAAFVFIFQVPFKSSFSALGQRNVYPSGRFAGGDILLIDSKLADRPWSLAISSIVQLG